MKLNKKKKKKIDMKTKSTKKREAEVSPFWEKDIKENQQKKKQKKRTELTMEVIKSSGKKMMKEWIDRIIHDYDFTEVDIYLEQVLSSLSTWMNQYNKLKEESYLLSVFYYCDQVINRVDKSR